MNRTTILTVIMFSLFHTLLFGQETAQFAKKELILGVNLTGNSYYGDINYNPNGSFLSRNTYLNVNPGVHFTFRQNQANRLSMVLTGGYGQILAQNPDLAPFYYGDPSDPRSLYIAPRYVSTDYLYGDVNLRFCPVRNIRAFARPYLQAGAGALLFFPEKNGSIRPKGANLERGESFSTISLSANAVLGTDINFSKHASLSLGTQLRLPMTDYMDWYGGKNVNSFRKQSGDFILSILVGANFKIFETNRPTIFQPRILNNLHQEKLPEDSIVLASTDDNFLPYLLRAKNDEPFNYYESFVYPPDLVPLAVLAKSIDCDSLSRIADQRISVLYAENLQLRAQYTKSQNKTNNSPTIANNEGDEEMKRMLTEAQAETEMVKMQAAAEKQANQTLLNKVAELEAQLLQVKIEKENTSLPAPTETAGNEDSLIRVIMRKDNEIASLQELLKRGTDAPTLAESEREAELIKENLTLKEENKKLHEGNNDISETPGFIELQQRYNSILVQNENLQKDLENAKAENQVLVGRLDQEHSAEVSSQGAANLEIDSLKRAILQLYSETSNRANMQSAKDSLAQIEFEGIMMQLDAANQKIANLEKSAVSPVNPSEVEGIQAALAEALAQKNATDAKFTELQTNINTYETEIANTKQSNDSLLNLVQTLQATATNTNPTPTETSPTVRETSLAQELEEVRAVALKAQEDKNMAEQNLTAAKVEIENLNERVAELQGNGGSSFAAEFQIARNRIDSLQRVTEEQASRLIMNDPTGSAPVVSTSAYQNLEARLAKAAEENAELDRQNQELKFTISNLSNATIPTAVIDMQVAIDSIKRENENLMAMNESLKGRISEIEAKPNVPVMPVVAGGEDSVLIASLQTQIAGLEEDKVALVNRNGEMQQQITKLEGDLAAAQNNVSQPTEGMVSQAEYDKVKQSVDILVGENKELKDKNEALQTQINAVVGNDPEERTLQIQQLENENTLLRQQVTKFATLNADMADMQNKILELETENKNLVAISNGTPSDVVINEGLRVKQEKITSLETELNDINAKFEAKNREYDLLVAANSVNKEKELTEQLEAAQAQATEFQAVIAKLSNENDSLINNNATTELAAVKTQVEGLRESNTDLLKKLNDAEDKIASDEEAMNGLKKAYDEIVANIPDKDAAAKLQTEVNDLKGLLTDATSQLEAAKELETQVTGLKAQLGEYEATNTALKTQVEGLNGQIADLQSSKPVGAEELAIMKKEVERLNEELKTRPTNEDAQAQIAGLQEQNQRMQTEIDRLSALGAAPSSEEVARQMRILQSERDSLQVLVNNGTATSPISAEQINLLNEQIVALQAENANQKATIESLNTGETINPQALAEVQAENTNLKSQLTEKEAQNGSLVSQVQTLNADVADLNEQLRKIPNAAELAILKKENERLNNEIANGSTSANPEMEAKVRELENDKERLTANVADLNKRMTDMAAEGGKDAVIAEMQAVITQKEEELVALNQKIANLPSVEEFAKLQVQLDNAVKNGGTTTVTDEAAQQEIADLKADKEKLIDKVGELTRELEKKPATDGEKDAQIADLTAKLANLPSAEDFASMKLREESLIAQNEQQETQIMELSKIIDDLESSNGDTAPLLQEIADLKKEIEERPDVTTYQVQIQNLTAEVERLKNVPTDETAANTIAILTTENQQLKDKVAELSTSGGGGTGDNSAEVIAQLQAKVQEQQTLIEQFQANPGTDATSSALVASLEAKVAEQAAQIRELSAGNAPESGMTEMVASMKLQLANQEAEIAQLKTTQMDASTANIVAERDAVRKQNEEIFNENEDYRNALGNALLAIEDLRKKVAMPTPDAGNESLIAKISELESELEVAKRNQTDGRKLAELEEQLSSAMAFNERLDKENEQLEKELEIAKSLDGDDNEEVTKLKADKMNLESKINENAGEMRKLQSQVAQQLDIISEKEKVLVANQAKIENLEAEIIGLKANVNISPIATNNIDYSRRIDSLKMVITTYQTKIKLIETNAPAQNTAQNVGATNITTQQLNQKVAEIEAREKRSKSREEYLESLNLDYQLQVEKGKYLNAKEIELQILAQKLGGFPDYFAEITQDGAPCSTVSASLDKPEVMERINSYFNTLGYKFRTSNGKMIFENVTIPEISKNPVNVVFYMMTSKSGKRIFQGVFQFVDNKNYITADRYPNETTRVLKLMQRLSQQ